MGLDMYLSRKSIDVKLKIIDALEEKEYEEVAYWRKANQIHNWFANNVGAVENCEEYEVSKENLLLLLNMCKIVLNNNKLAEEYLPTTSGFFFGDTEYNQYYFNDIEKTIEILNKILEETDFDKQKIFYYASW
jgi:hypothetical protein